MASVSGLHILFWLLLWGALLRVFEIKYHDSANFLGSTARALQVIY